MKNYTSVPQEGQPLKNSQGFVIGWIQGDKFVKYVYESRHMLKSPRGWSIDFTCVEQARAAGVQTVVIIDRETGKTYTAPLAMFWTDGQLVDRGYGLQRCLPLEHWQIRR